jgi:hypothetical protein
MLLVSIKKETYYTKKNGWIYKISLGIIDFYLLSFFALLIFNFFIIFFWILNKIKFSLSGVISPNIMDITSLLKGIFKYIFLIIVVLYIVLLFLRKYHVNKN